MKALTKLGRLLLLSAAVGVVCLSGCGVLGVGADDDTGSNCTSAENCRQVTIGSQTWMAENLNVKTTGSMCYYDSASYCRKYGRLYTWEAAKKACPMGWHLPSREEWNALSEYAGGDDVAGGKLKAKSGWANTGFGQSGNGTDEYGLYAHPPQTPVFSMLSAKPLTTK